MAEILALSVAGGALFVNWARFRDPLYPACVQAGIWFVVLLGLVFAEETYSPISSTTYLLVAIGILGFSAGCYAATFQHQSQKHPHPIPKRPGVGIVVVLLGVIATALLPLFVLQALALASEGPSDSFLFNVRYSRTQEGGSFGISSYGGVVATFACAVLVLHFDRFASWVTAGMIAVALTYGVLSTGRTSLFLLLITLFTVLAMRRSMRLTWLIALSLAALLIAFVLLGLVLSKGIVLNQEGFPWREALVSIRDYLLSPLPALDQLIKSDPPLTFGENIFRFWLVLLGKLGFDSSVRPLVQEYALVPIATNVYTVYQPYIVDFGLVCAAFIQLPFGAIHGFLYRFASKGNDVAVLAYSLLMYPLFMQFFQDQYFNLLSTWLQVSFCLAIYWFFTRSTRAPNAWLQ